MKHVHVLVALALLVPAPVQAQSCRAESGAALRPLVELYTSEGCDSCPPADRWLSSTLTGADAPAIALGFHVDYWDRLGWKDRFAAHAYTERQYASAATSGADFVYTPQVLLQGRDVPWRGGRFEHALAQARAGKPHAAIDVTATPRGDAVDVDAHARVADAAKRDGAVLALAYVDNGLVSQVQAGENRGARLSHDRVVRAFATVARVDATGAADGHARFALPAERGDDAAIVAFVQRARDGEVLQAVELPLAACAH